MVVSNLTFSVTQSPICWFPRVNQLVWINVSVCTSALATEHCSSSLRSQLYPSSVCDWWRHAWPIVLWTIPFTHNSWTWHLSKLKLLALINLVGNWWYNSNTHVFQLGNPGSNPDWGRGYTPLIGSRKNGTPIWRFHGCKGGNKIGGLCVKGGAGQPKLVFELVNT